MANTIFTYGLSKFIDRTYRLGVTSFNIMLVRVSYTPDKKHRSLTEMQLAGNNEVTAFNSRKSFGVLSGTIDDTNNKVTIAGPGNMSWSGASTSVRYVLIYFNTGNDNTSIPIYLIDLGTSRTMTTSLTISFTSNIIFSLKHEDATVFNTTLNYTNGGLLKILDGTIDLINDTLKIILLKSSYSFGPGEIDKDDCSSMTASEASGTNYTAGYGGVGRKTVTNKTITVDDANNRVSFSFNHPGYINLDSIGDVKYAVLIKETGGSDSTAIPICIFRSALPALLAASKGDLQLNFHAAGAMHFKEG